MAVRKALPVLAAVAGIVGLWYFVTYVILSPQRRFLLPPPHQVIGNTITNSTVMSPMLHALGQTTKVALSGLVIAIAIGVLWAVLMSSSPFMEKVFYPYAVILQTVPILALTPLIGIWLNYGMNARVVVAVIISVFPMISNTFFGLQAASAEAHDVFTLNRSSRLHRLVKLQLPAAVPSIFTGLRNAAGLSVIGALVGDYYFEQGAPGIGGLLRTYTLTLTMDPLFMAIILTVLFGILIFSFFAVLDRAIVTRWYGRRSS